MPSPACIAHEKNTGARRAHLFLEVVPLDDVEQRFSSLLSECFTAQETSELSGRLSQTVAGFLALKRALCALFSSLEFSRSFSEKDFSLTHDEQGAPQLSSWPPLGPAVGFSTAGLRVSISHSRRLACGLVVYQENPDA